MCFRDVVGVIFVIDCIVLYVMVVEEVMFFVDVESFEVVVIIFVMVSLNNLNLIFFVVYNFLVKLIYYLMMEIIF